ncbi:beta family protein [Dyadobacter jiangsuensis]|uniref:T4 beta protein n=1 Tax=Dyadobacter jiangsuensis TaxID=1591085 RepID=A0A2P8FVG1_9BACT|nr:hypothetical protein [Dyadobacter jiangsuensis]PSL25708.1 T4 beta protein [Dyadobacter jiangsuensis]
MDHQLIYVPVFKSLQEEQKVLQSFDFQDRIYPYLEIIKEVDRKPSIRKNPERTAKKVTPPKTFEHVYIPIIRNIKARRVFVDLPVHIKSRRDMKPEVLTFLQTVVANRANRTDFMKKLSPLSKKVIPVISSYYARTAEANSIILQATELRRHFENLAFRTSYDSFSRDLNQIKSQVLPNDYLILDWEDLPLLNKISQHSEIIESLRELNCTIVIHKSAVPSDITNTGLDHGEVIDTIDNSLINAYKGLGAHCFSDFCGIKKHNLGKGGRISPGFIYYDAVTNKFYGYKGVNQELYEFETIIIPAILSSEATARMLESEIDFLGGTNVGWQTINRISNNLESGQNAGKFKKIGMEHYLHCLKSRIDNGDFN